MNEVNEAYDRITNPEKYQASDRRAAHASGGYGGSGYAGGNSGGQGSANYGGYGGAGQGYSSSGPYGWSTIDFDDIFGFGGMGGFGAIHPEASASDTAEIRSAIDAINAGRYQQATTILNQVKARGAMPAITTSVLLLTMEPVIPCWRMSKFVVP